MRARTKSCNYERPIRARIHNPNSLVDQAVPIDFDSIEEEEQPLPPPPPLLLEVSPIPHALWCRLVGYKTTAQNSLFNWVPCDFGHVLFAVIGQKYLAH